MSNPQWGAIQRFALAATVSYPLRSKTAGKSRLPLHLQLRLDVGMLAAGDGRQATARGSLPVNIDACEGAVQQAVA